MTREMQGVQENLHDLVIPSQKSERARESNHHGVEAPFPLSRMPASIELSIKLVVCLSVCIKTTPWRILQLKHPTTTNEKTLAKQSEALTHSLGYPDQRPAKQHQRMIHR